MITAAVVDVLSRLGFSGFTMDEVALTAGVGKAAIYRRWASKTDVTCSLTDDPSDCGDGGRRDRGAR